MIPFFSSPSNYFSSNRRIMKQQPVIVFVNDRRIEGLMLLCQQVVFENEISFNWFSLNCYFKYTERSSLFESNSRIYCCCMSITKNLASWKMDRFVPCLTFRGLLGQIPSSESLVGCLNGKNDFKLQQHNINLVYFPSFWLRISIYTLENNF